MERTGLAVYRSIYRMTLYPCRINFPKVINCRSPVAITCLLWRRRDSTLFLFLILLCTCSERRNGCCLSSPDNRTYLASWGLLVASSCRLTYLTCELPCSGKLASREAPKGYGDFSRTSTTKTSRNRFVTLSEVLLRLWRAWQSEAIGLFKRRNAITSPSHVRR